MRVERIAESTGNESETNKGENLNRVPCSRLASMSCHGPCGGESDACWISDHWPLMLALRASMAP